MSRANDLLDRGRGYSRIWTEFILAYQKNPSRLYCFFEGMDGPKYYNPRIKSIIFHNSNEDLQNFWCKGKQNVIEVFGLISNDVRFEKAWVAFFIDKDFDEIEELPADSRVFVTPCYAIENLYVNQRVVRQILRDEFSLSESEEDFQSTVTLFNNMLEKFNDVMDDLNAWLYLQRRMEKLTRSNSKVYINNLSHNHLFTIRLNQITKNYTLNDLIKKFLDAPIVNETDINSQISEFRKKDRTLIFRGKYLIFFQKRFFMCLVEDRRRKNNREHFINRGQVSLQLSDNTLVSAKSELTKSLEQ